MGELLKELNIPRVGNIETRLCWGKGLNTIVATAKEAVEAMNHDNFIKGHHSRKILIIVGSSGNDVYGDYGYQGCSWIHQSRYLKSDADRKVAADWPAKQKARVEQSIADLIEMKKMAGVADMVVFGNGNHADYGLPPSYNITLGKHFPRQVILRLTTWTSPTGRPFRRPASHMSLILCLWHPPMESIILDDDQNIEEVESFTQGSVTLTARKDDVDMKEPEKTTTKDPVEVKVEKEEEKQAGRPAEVLMASTKKEFKPVPERPLEVKKIDNVEERLARAQAEDRVWLDPTDLSFRFPYKNVNNNGRLLQILKKLSYFLRGHPLEYGHPCPDFNFLDLSVKWEDLMEHMKKKVWELEDWEVLQVVRSSDTRRFQVQVARPEGPNATWKGLPWMPVACRTFQGHNGALMDKASIGQMVKELYTLDPEFIPAHLDVEPPQWPRFNYNPKQAEMYEKFPRLVYHSCDLSHVDDIINQGLIPQLFFHHASLGCQFEKAFAGMRAGKPMYVAFDVELMMQGCRVFKTDEAILSPDWVSNECIVAVYDSHQRDFYHFNRAYSAYRKEYNNKTSSQDSSTTKFEDSQI